jgi:hypothetical protein
MDYVGDGTGAGGGGFGVDQRSVKLAESLYRYTWRAVDGEVYSLDPGQRQQLAMPDKSDQKIADITVGLEHLAEILPGDIKSRPTLAYLPAEVKAEAREFAGRILDAGGYHFRLAELSPETAQQVKERVAEQALSLAAGLKPREIEITMIVHEDRAAKAIECCRAARSDFIGDDKEETAWTVEAMYRSLTRLGVGEDQARQCAIEWARGTDVDTNAVIDKYQTKMAIRAKRDERDGDQPKEPPVISRRDWTRLTQNLCLQDEKLLYPWYGVMRQPGRQSEAGKDATVDIPHQPGRGSHSGRCPGVAGCAGETRRPGGTGVDGPDLCGCVARSGRRRGRKSGCDLQLGQDSRGGDPGGAAARYFRPAIVAG